MAKVIRRFRPTHVPSLDPLVPAALSLPFSTTFCAMILFLFSQSVCSFHLCASRRDSHTVRVCLMKFRMCAQPDARQERLGARTAWLEGI